MMFLAVLFGVLVGIFSGILGVGGGIVLIPILMYVFHLNQYAAQGTSLAVLMLPVVLPAVWTYYRAGDVNVPLALVLAAGFIVGGYFGGTFAHIMPVSVLRKIFAVILFLLACKMFFD